MKENDCISRKRAIERLKLNLPISQGADNSRDRHRYMQAMADIQAIRELPSVTPQEPKIGHWIEHPHEAGPCWEYSRYECSECHDWADDDSDFCPDCGAKMVEPQESEE